MSWSRSGTNPSVKKWGSGTDPRVQKIMLWDQSLRLLVLWSQNSIFWVLGFDPRTRNCYLWDHMLSSYPISSPCGQFFYLTQPKIGKFFTIKSQRKEFEVPRSIPEFIKCCSGIGPSILRDQSLNCILWTLGSLPEPHFFDAGIDPRPWLGLLIFTWNIHLYSL